MKHTKYISILFLLLATSIAYAQVRFEVKVNKEELGVNEHLRIQFEINEEDVDFNPPEFKNFRVMRGPNKNMHSSWVAGKESYKTTISYIIKPNKKGTLIINSGMFTLDDSIYKTEPITIKVTKKVKIKKFDIKKSVFHKDIYLHQECSKKKISSGDSLIITYKLYVSEKLGVIKWDNVSEPQFKNFTIKDITPDTLKLQNELIKDQNYRYVVLKKVMLSPNKKGKFKISPYKLEASIEIPTEKTDFFKTKVMEDRQIVLSTDKLIIDVNE